MRTQCTQLKLGVNENRVCSKGETRHEKAKPHKCGTPTRSLDAVRMLLKMFDEKGRWWRLIVDGECELEITD